MLECSWVPYSLGQSWKMVKPGTAASCWTNRQSTIEPRKMASVLCVCVCCLCLPECVCLSCTVMQLYVIWLNQRMCIQIYIYIICTILVSRSACVCVWVDMHPFKLYLHNVRPGGKVQKLAGWDKHVDVQMLKVWNDASDHIILEQCAYSCAANI